ADGKLVELPGVEPIAGCKQKLVQWCFDEISPPVVIEVSEGIPSPTDGTRVCYVLKIDESEAAPHFINGRRGIYVRTDEFSQLFEPHPAKLEEILRLVERRQRVVERASRLQERTRRRWTTFAESKYSELGNKESLGAHFSLTISPRYPTAPLFDPYVLHALSETLTVPWRQVGFPRFAKGIVSQHESVLVLRPGSSFSLLELTMWGHLTYSSEIEIEVGDKTVTGIHLNHFVGHILVFLEHAASLLRKSSFRGELELTLELHGIKGVK